MIGTMLARRAVAQAFDALNRRDLPAFMSAWNDAGVFVYPGDIPESGIYDGRKAVEAWFQHFFEQFPRVWFEVKTVAMRDSFDLVGNNVASVQWDLTVLNREGHQGRNSGVTVITIERGKAIHAQDFIFDLGDEFRRYWSAPVSSAVQTP